MIMNKKRVITGLHILGEIYSNNIENLKSSSKIKKDISKIIKKYSLTELGSFYYQFPKSGFTGIVSLVESHIAIHTWPEFGYLTLDVYICSYIEDNSNVCKEIFIEISNLFKPIKLTRRLIKR